MKSGPSIELTWSGWGQGEKRLANDLVTVKAGGEGTRSLDTRLFPLLCYVRIFP